MIRLALFLALALPCAAALADLATAERQVRDQQLDAARATLEAHLAQQPGDQEARFLLARVYAWQGRPEDALPIYESLLSSQPDNADYLLGQGQALLWAGFPQRALESLERAAAIAPDYGDIQTAIQQARAALAVPVIAAAPVSDLSTQRRHELQISTRKDSLDNGFDDWRSHRLDYTSTRPEGPAWYGALLREQRFGEWDEGVEAGAILPLNEKWTLQPEVGYQPSPYFLPEWHADLRLQRRFEAGYLGAVSVRRTEYETTRVDRLALGAERYFGNWRAGYTLNITDVANAGTPVGHNLGLDYYYRGLSYAGVRLTAGEEEAVEEQQLITSDVRAISLQGRHWFSRRWAMTWEVGHHEQGDYYTRQWLQLGLRHAF
ncbi:MULTISPECIES: YaiO family outer membrane beta-barrel protein [Pseudomonadaceae]|uniref:YaiO family outer membrane beta-barrel protein n=1 Tax=Pseudomonadaceae TaxID=135621 RepID=UPI00187D2007|nr:MULTISPECIES: YaiO family outer membrane beta-barrel protein [Pseudomonadaceae]MBE7927706.1 YaiO family outer membrane beta-barrel protein [Pseudomonas saudiphocaensis]MCF6780952.1 YaiO family outer membrane beta-barrel protein [Stutzerimonas stutzeri]MCF6803520.1 YaiO family outer membrane beta-barrel protein [Stutzerimonas stutzeri]